MYDLSIVIPARNEEWLSRTIDDLIKNKRGKTEVIVILDGYWPEPGIVDHDDVRIIHLQESIGQRAAQNLGVSLSRAKYVAKTDAHCAFDEGFDVKLMAKMADDITMVPVMRNLHIFNWRCVLCGLEEYQGPEPTQCRNEECANDPQKFEKNVVWIPKTNPQSSAYRFNKNLQFKYFPELRARLPREGLQESMSLQGSFFMCTREKYWQLKLCDESWGSWGQQGSEVALKTWLSGGRVLCNFDTWYAHLFRTQHGFSFPYPQSGKSQDNARKISREIFLNDKWEQAVHPLSWLIEKFWFALKEVQDNEAKWEESDVKPTQLPSKATITFPRQQSIAGLTASTSTSGDFGGELMPTDTMGATSLNGTITIPSKDIDAVADQSKVVGINTTAIVANMVNDRDIGPKISSKRTNQPSIHNSVNSNLWTPETDSTVPEIIAVASPLPATSEVIQSFTRGILYFTDNELPLKIAKEVQDRIRLIAQQKGMELVSSSRKPMVNMGRNVVTKRPRGYHTMFEQILKGLEAMESDTVFMAEHDVLYPPEHFDFVPKDDSVYYDINWWKIHPDGLTIHWDADQVSGMCAPRDKLIAYYKWRVETFDKKNFDRKFEPLSGEGSKQWKAPVPHIDIRHGKNLTYNKRSINDFRKKESAVNLETTTLEHIPGWDNLADVFK
jgi:hypothetical protein